ncbi:MAG: murein biosynthesis integral membrane protein MurJ [Rhodothermales bacterium]|nr:murein biosynthesis integral membrane protein MurJ [Rhodothermales bacterium]
MTDVASESSAESPPEPAPRKSAAGTVAAGIFSSRIIGFVREGAVTYFFGVSAFYDVFQAALKGPNLLQNLLGEGTISAAFIPVYSRLIEEGRREEAGRFAGAIFGLLLAVAAGLVLLGITFAEQLVTVLTPGFTDDAAKVARGELPINRFTVTVQAVRIIFPMTGVLVLSAWALGILNSHRRFFLPYFAPVLWNVAIVGGLFGFAFWQIDDPLALGETGLPAEVLRQLLFAAFWGALVGGALQFLVQLPLVFGLLKGFRVSLSTKVTGVREAVNAFGPVVAGRGVYQLSGYLDVLLASLLAAGALGALRPALMLYGLPVALFGLSVAASELPELARVGAEARQSFLTRLERSMRQTLFLTVPSAIGYLGLGFLIVGALFRRGAFGLNDNWLVYVVLAGYSLGLIATTVSRLLQNAFYALQDTKTPAKIAVLRVVVSGALAVPLMFFFDRYAVSGTLGFTAEGTRLYFGALGLALGTTAGAWIELWRLVRALKTRMPACHIPWAGMAKMAALATVALAPAGLVWWLVAGWPVLVVAVLVVATFAAAYLILARLLGFDEIDAWAGRFLQRFK